MTKEQEAIERLNRFKTIEVLYSNTFAMHIEQLKTVQEDIETVLNMLKEKDKQIDLMAETIRKLSIGLANYKGSYDKETINFTGNIKKINQYFEKLAKEKGE